MRDETAYVEHPGCCRTPWSMRHSNSPDSDYAECVARPTNRAREIAKSMNCDATEVGVSGCGQCEVHLNSDDRSS